MSQDILNIAHLCPSTAALGPWNRFAIWVQGCPFTCPGCLAPEWIPFKVANTISVESLAEAIIRQETIEGITLSGGEPLMQAGRLATLLRLVRAVRPELTVIVFSGFVREQLVWEEASALLSYVDLLIDGQYVNKLNDGRGLRGSSNQQFHFLTDRLLPYRETILNNRPGMEFHFLNDGVLSAGIPPPNFSW